MKAITVVCLAAAVIGCAPPKAPTAPPNDRISVVPDPSNPSNRVVTITFANPIPTDEVFDGRPVHIRFGEARLKPLSTAKNQELASPLPLLHDKEHSESTLTFSLPAADIGRRTVVLYGGDNKPLGEAAVIREIRVEDPNNRLENIGTNAPNSQP